jgi:DNA-binding transcriptional LysR family regulator
MSFGTRYLGIAVAEFMQRYPELTIELILNDRFIDPLEEGVDVTVRIGALADSSLIARRLSPARLSLVAAPSYLTKNGTPATPQELSQHACLTYGHMSGVQRWTLQDKDEATINVPISSRLCSNNGDILRDAALAGLGIANLPTFLVGPDIAAARLSVVLPATQPASLAIYALYAPNRYLAAKTRLFIDFLAARFGENPQWDAFARP